MKFGEIQPIIRAMTRVGGLGGRRAAALPGPIEPDKSSLWMDLFSLDSVILIIVTCNCLPFSYWRSIFRRHLSWQVLKIAFRSLQIWKSSGGGYPQTHLQCTCFRSALGIMHPPPPPTRYNKPSYDPDNTDRKGREEAIVSVLSSVQIKRAVRKKGTDTCYI